MSERTYNLMVYWYCRVCWSKGVMSVTIRAYNDLFTPPTKKDLERLAIASCHIMPQTDCTKPDIRLHYDEKAKKAN